MQVLRIALGFLVYPPMKSTGHNRHDRTLPVLWCVVYSSYFEASQFLVWEDKKKLPAVDNFSNPFSSRIRRFESALVVFVLLLLFWES